MSRKLCDDGRGECRVATCTSSAALLLALTLSQVQAQYSLSRVYRDIVHWHAMALRRSPPRPRPALGMIQWGLKKQRDNLMSSTILYLQINQDMACTMYEHGSIDVSLIRINLSCRRSCVSGYILYMVPHTTRAPAGGFSPCSQGPPRC